MSSLHIHVLFEHGNDNNPFASSSIRLLRPLSHPALAGLFRMTAGLEYEGQSADAVIVDRLWRPDISLDLATRLLDRVHQAGARLLYAIDDNLPELVSERKDWQPSPDQLGALDFFLRHADGIIVTTTALREQMLSLNPRIAIVPNVLDERLLTGGWRSFWLHRNMRYLRRIKRKAFCEPHVIGYMGTLTHDDDLLMILPALQSVCRRYGDNIILEMVGVVAHSETIKHLEGLPLRMINPALAHNPYSEFMTWFSNRLKVAPSFFDHKYNDPYPVFLDWFSSHFRWDIALAPLRDTIFNRCKSDIKFLDYSAISAAGVYSRVPAYEYTVRHQQNGLLVENTVEAWEAALEQLLANVELRFALGLAAARYLYDQRTIASSRLYWANAMEQLLKE